MIRFLEDWKKYPKAIVHTKTRNKSFVRLSALYKKMGMKNHTFPLALHNKELEDVDPHSPNLTDKEKVLIIQEIFKNPWYFFREVARLPASGSEPVMVNANRANVAYWWCYNNHQTILLIQPRQTGKTSAMMLMIIYILFFGGVNIHIVLLTRGTDLRVKTIKELKSVIAALPEFLQLRAKTDSDNSENLTFNQMGNRLDVFVAQNDPEAAGKQGRGLTTANMFVDEYAFYAYNWVTVPAAFAATTAAMDSAKRSGSPYGIAMTTTPGYLKSKSGAYAKKDYDICCRWVETMLDLENEEELNNYVDKNTRGKGNKQVLIEFSHRQLGYTDEWMQEKISKAKAEGDVAEAEFLMKWSYGDIESPIDKATILRLQNSIRNPDLINIHKNNFAINWYREDALEYYEDKPFIIGMDSSEMIGTDDSTLVLRDISTGEVIGTGRYNNTNLVSFADFIADLLISFPEAVFIPEAKSTGVMIIDYVIKILHQKRINPFTRIYNKLVENSHINDRYDEVLREYERRRNENILDQYKKEFGYRTSGGGSNSRATLYGQVFSSSLKHTADVAYDKTLVSQLLSLQRRNGRIDHPADGHDDIVMGWLLTGWFLLYAENKDYYGIDNREVFSTVKLNAITRSEGGDEKVYDRLVCTELKNEIKELAAKVPKMPDYITKHALLTKMAFLYRELSEYDDDDLISINELIENIKLETKSAR